MRPRSAPTSPTTQQVAASQGGRANGVKVRRWAPLRRGSYDAPSDASLGASPWLSNQGRRGAARFLPVRRAHMWEPIGVAASGLLCQNRFLGYRFFWISKIHTRPEGRGALAWVVVVVVGGTVVQCGDAVSCVVEWSCRRLHGSRRICVGHSHGHSLDAPGIDKSDCTAHGNQFCPRAPRKHHGKHVCPPMCPCMCPPRHRPRAAVPRGTAKHTPSQAPSAVRAGARRKEKDQRTRRDET